MLALYGNSGGKKSEKSSSQASGPIAQEEHQREKWYWVANRQSCIRFQGARRQRGSNDKNPSLYWKANAFVTFSRSRTMSPFFPFDWKGMKKSLLCQSSLCWCIKTIQIVSCRVRWCKSYHRVGWSSQYLNSYSGEVKNPGLFWLKVQFHTLKQRKWNHQCVTYQSQKMRWGETGAQWTEERALLTLLHPRSQVSRRYRAGIAGTCYLWGNWACVHWVFLGSTPK